jgi:Mg2+-importing ATPase
MTLTTLTIMAIGAWLPYSSFAAALGMVPLPPIYWVWIGAFLFSYALLTHTVKTWFFTHYGDD